MSLMDKILNTALIMWSISFIVGIAMLFIGDATGRDEICKASVYFMYGLIGLLFAGICIWGLAGIWMYLQEMWG